MVFLPNLSSLLAVSGLIAAGDELVTDEGVTVVLGVSLVLLLPSVGAVDLDEDFPVDDT